MEENEKEPQNYLCNHQNQTSEQEHNILECKLDLPLDIDIVLGLSYVQNSIELVFRWLF